MTTSLHCTPALHIALTADRRAFEQQPYLGLELAAGDVVELRCCSVCCGTLRRPLGIDVRLAAARGGDQSMIGHCKRALSPDPFTGLLDESAVRSWLDAVAMEDLMRRTVGS
jgi:hypothetical protein